MSLIESDRLVVPIEDTLRVMELRHLRYFLAVAEMLHFGRAAKKIRVSQPTLSQQIRQLEDELGATLFERGRAGVELTQAGDLFRAYASRAIEDVSAGQRAVGALQRLDAGVVRIGYLPSLRALVVPALAAVLRKHPGVQIAAEEAVARRVERRVAEGKLDVGLSYAPVRTPEVETEVVVESRLGLVVSRAHPLAASKRVNVRQLVDEPFALLSPGLRARASVDAYFASNRISPRVVLESNAVATLLAAVRAGLAVTVLPEPRFADTHKLPVLSLSPAPQSQLAALLWRRETPRAPAATALADEIRAARELRGD